MQYTIDRFEGGIAVCEDDGGEIVNIDAALITGSAREGDVITGTPELGFTVDVEGTKARRRAAEASLTDLFFREQ